MNSKTVENIQNELIEIHTNAKHSETLHTGVIDFLTRGLVCVRGKNNNIFFYRFLLLYRERNATKQEMHLRRSLSFDH